MNIKSLKESFIDTERLCFVMFPARKLLLTVDQEQAASNHGEVQINSWDQSQAGVRVDCSLHDAHHHPQAGGICQKWPDIIQEETLFRPP